MPRFASFNYSSLDATLYNITSDSAVSVGRSFFIRKMMDYLFSANGNSVVKEVTNASPTPAFLQPFASTIPTNVAVNVTTAGQHVTCYFIDDIGLDLTPKRARLMRFEHEIHTTTTSRVCSVKFFEVTEGLGANQELLLDGTSGITNPLQLSSSLSQNSALALNTYPRVGFWWNENLFVMLGFNSSTFGFASGIQVYRFDSVNGDAALGDMVGYTSLGLVDRANFHGYGANTTQSNAIGIPGGPAFPSEASRWAWVSSSGGVSSALLSNGAGNKVIGAKFQMVASRQEYHVMSNTIPDAIVIHESLVGAQNTVMNINNVKHIVAGPTSATGTKILLPEPA
jgi:hypothetical protein